MGVREREDFVDFLVDVEVGQDGQRVVDIIDEQVVVVVTHSRPNVALAREESLAGHWHTVAL